MREKIMAEEESMDPLEGMGESANEATGEYAEKLKKKAEEKSESE